MFELIWLIADASILLIYLFSFLVCPFLEGEKIIIVR